MLQTSQTSSKVEKNAVEKQTQADRAKKDAEIADKKAKDAEKIAQKAQGDLTKTQAEKEKISEEATRLQKEAIRLGGVAKQAEENATRATIAENNAIQATLKARQDESEVQDSLKKTNEALKEIKSLSKLAAELRKKGNIEASNELSTRVTSSVLIEDYELKRIWLLATKAQAKKSLGNLDKQELQKFNQSLDSLKNISSKNDSGIVNQVKAFVYLIAGQLNNNNEQDYRTAYKALRASQLNLYDDKTDTDMITEKDVDNINYQLIKANRVDINSSNEVAKNFRNHLYNGLEFLLKNDRLKDADQRTTNIMLYIAGKDEDRFLNEDDLTNFSCDALQEIDKHWYNYPQSPHKFGFRVQKNIWENNGRPTANFSSQADWIKFYIALGWITEDFRSWSGMKEHDQILGEKVDTMKTGQLPLSGNIWIQQGWYSFMVFGFASSRCKLPPVVRSLGYFDNRKPNIPRLELVSTDDEVY